MSKPVPVLPPGASSAPPVVVAPPWAARYKKEPLPPHRQRIQSHAAAAAAPPAPVLTSSDFPLLVQHQGKATPAAATSARGGSHIRLPLSGCVPAAHPSCNAIVGVAAAVEDGLEEQWGIVYDPAGTERDRERGGLVLRDGSINPGHYCFNPDPTYPLSPLSAITPGTGGAVRLGDCGEVSAGWDHTKVVGSDPSTHKHAVTVYAHFHVHADNADLVSHRSGGQAAKEPRSTACGGKPKLTPPKLRPASAPSMGDVAAWLCYHRNQPRAFVLTRDSCWLLFKWKIPGHAKGGVECPSDVTHPFFEHCNRRRYESINSAAGALLRGLPQHGFAIYVRKLADRAPHSNGVYRMWVPPSR